MKLKYPIFVTFCSVIVIINLPGMPLPIRVAAYAIGFLLGMLSSGMKLVAGQSVLKITHVTS